MTTCIFVQIRCHPGKTYDVADALALELYVGGRWDTLGAFPYLPWTGALGAIVSALDSAARETLLPLALQLEGDYDLLLKVYVPAGEDVGRFVNDHISLTDGVDRTLTTLTFSAF